MLFLQVILSYVQRYFNGSFWPTSVTMEQVYFTDSSLQMKRTTLVTKLILSVLMGSCTNVVYCTTNQNYQASNTIIDDNENLGVSDNVGLEIQGITSSHSNIVSSIESKFTYLNNSFSTHSNNRNGYNKKCYVYLQIRNITGSCLISTFMFSINESC